MIKFNLNVERTEQAIDEYIGKAKDKESLWESEEVYRFLICAVCPVSGDYEPGMPVCGFMFPAFKDRGPDNGRIQVFEADPARPHRDFLNLILPVSAYIL